MSLSALSLLQNVQPKAGSPGVVEAPAGTATQPSAPGAGASAFSMFLPLLILVPFFFMTFRRQKKEAEQRSKLKKGDRVVSQSGLIGELVEMDERFAKVQIAPGCKVQMLSNSISPLGPEAAVANRSGEAALQDLKDAKALADKK